MSINTNSEKNKKNWIQISIISCFFLSGLLGLIYEIIWIRKLGLIFGTTVFAITTVLTAFFGGLALGSYLFGKWSGKIKNPVKIYAILEAGISIFAILFPLLLKLFGLLYSVIYGIIYQNSFILTSTRFIFFVILLLIPTTMMGGTLPLLSQYFIRNKESIGARIGVLYGINTIGATIGAFLCGFFFIRYIGIETTNYLAGLINIIVAVIAYLLGKKIIYYSNEDSSKEIESNSYRNDIKNPSIKYIPLSFFLSGFASIGYEVVWTRYLSLPLANTRYTYTLILVVFLMGIGIGSFIFARLSDRIKNSIRLFACLQIGIGFSAFLLVPMVYYLATNAKYSLLLYDFIACAILMLIPTILMGATFPIVVRIMTSETSFIGRSTGRLYAFNTAGNILGSLLTGFLLIPVFGIKISLAFLIAINLIIGFFLLFRDSKKNWIINSIISLFALVAFLAVHFSLKVDIPRDFLNILKGETEEITLIKEGLENTVWVTVNNQNQQKSVWANQTVLGRTMPKEPYSFSPQIIQGHVPMLLHAGSPKKVLGICLGTGQTFGSILSYSIEKMDLVEISKTITNVALNDFREQNKNLGSDKRVNIIIEDGRNYVAHTKNKYDIITLEPSPPEEAGIVNLYTKEFYELCKKRLNEDGIMSQWLPIYNTHPDETARIIKTFISVFPESVLWYNEADLILLGFKGGIKIDYNKIISLLEMKSISNDLNISYLDNKEYSLNKIDNLMACFLMGPNELKRFSENYALITDNHPDLEYTFLKYENVDNKPELMKILNAEKISQYLIQMADTSSTRKKYLSRLIAESYNRIAISKRDNPDEMVKMLKKALEYDPDYGMAHANLGTYYYQQGKLQESISAFEKATSLLPEISSLWYVLGSAYWQLEKIDNAFIAWENALKVKPDYADVYNELGAAYSSSGRLNEAIQAYKNAIKYKPDYAEAYYNLGLVYEATEQWKDAMSSFKKAIEINPSFEEAYSHLNNIIR